MQKYFLSPLLFLATFSLFTMQPQQAPPLVAPPIAEQPQQELPRLLFNVGLSERQGLRDAMEDTSCAAFQINGDYQHVFFALFDGHSGIEVANLAAENLFKIYETKIKQGLPVKQALTGAFLQFDSVIASARIPSGCTALIAVINHDLLYLAWAGDSRCLFLRKKESGKYGLIHTVDHTMHNEKEYARVTADSSARIMRTQGGVMRISGVGISQGIIPTRVLGDIDIKYATSALIAAPEFIGPFHVKAGDVIILACDRVWDVFHDAVGEDEVSQLVINTLQTTPERRAKIEAMYAKFGPSQTEIVHEQGTDQRMILAARRVREKAYMRNSGDNISVMVIEIQSFDEPTEEDSSTSMEM